MLLFIKLSECWVVQRNELEGTSSHLGWKQRENLKTVGMLKKNLLNLRLGQLQGRGIMRGQGNSVAFLPHWPLIRCQGKSWSSQDLPSRFHAEWTARTPNNSTQRRGGTLLIPHPGSHLSYYWIFFLAFQWVCAMALALLSWLAPALPGSSYTRPERKTAAGCKTDNCYKIDNCYETENCYKIDNSRNAALYWCLTGFWTHHH